MSKRKATQPVNDPNKEFWMVIYTPEDASQPTVTFIPKCEFTIDFSRDVFEQTRDAIEKIYGVYGEFFLFSNAKEIAEFTSENIITVIGYGWE